MDIRFIADRNLGTLAKWLRILGYDTLYERGNADLDFLRKAAEEGRVALTRKRDIARRPHMVRLVVVKADHARDQLTEVLEALTIIPNPVKRMTLCLRCNAPLEAIPKETVEGLVPVYVYQKYRQFRRCPLCGRIYLAWDAPRACRGAPQGAASLSDSFVLTRNCQANTTASRTRPMRSVIHPGLIRQSAATNRITRCHIVADRIR